MRRWALSLVSFAGVLATVLAYRFFGPLPAGMLAFATLCHAALGKDFLGDPLVGPPGDVDVQAVRRYREAHPDATISEAVAKTRSR